MTDTNFLGELEEMVLLATLRLGDEAYGAAILRELDERAGRDVSRGSVYVVLERLDGKGMLTSRLGAATPDRGGRPRRFVTVTSEGVEALRRSYAARTRLREGLGHVFGS